MVPGLARADKGVGRDLGGTGKLGIIVDGTTDGTGNTELMGDGLIPSPTVMFHGM